MNKKWIFYCLSLFLFTSCEIAPYACFNVDPDFGTTATFYSDCTIDAETFEWEFGDGAKTVGPNPTHDYGTTGEWTATLKVTL